MKIIFRWLTNDVECRICDGGYLVKKPLVDPHVSLTFMQSNIKVDFCASWRIVYFVSTIPCMLSGVFILIFKIASCDVFKSLISFYVGDMKPWIISSTRFNLKVHVESIS